MVDHLQKPEKNLLVENENARKKWMSKNHLMRF